MKVGDKVAGCFFQRWPGGLPAADTQASALGGAIDGMLTEYVVLEEEGVVKLPAHLSLEEGACLPCAGVTAWNALAEHGKPHRRRQRSGAGHRRRVDVRACNSRG